jgi:hypothetical protein
MACIMLNKLQYDNQKAANSHVTHAKQSGENINRPAAIGLK